MQKNKCIILLYLLSPDTIQTDHFSLSNSLRILFLILYGVIFGC